MRETPTGGCALTAGVSSLGSYGATRPSEEICLHHCIAIRNCAKGRSRYGVVRSRTRVNGPRREIGMVYLGLDEESALLGMFEKGPETLARIMLSELVKRQTGKHAR